MTDPRTSGLGPGLPQVVRDLLDDYPLDAVVEEAVTRMRDQVPDFRSVDGARLRTDMAGALALAVAAVRDGTGATDLAVEGLRTIGALRAEQGIGMDAMLAGFRVIAKTAVDAVLDLAVQRGVDPEATLELTRAVWAHCDDAALALAAGHRAFTADPSRLQMRHGVSALRLLVRDGVAADRREAACAELGLSAEGRYRAVAISTGDGPPTALADDVEERLLAVYPDLDGGRAVGVLEGLPLEPWGCFVGYGDEVGPADLPRSLRGAVEAQQLAEAFHLERPQHPDDVRLLRPVHDLPVLGDELVERCFGHLDAARRDATTGTLRAWFDARGSADAAAEALFVHKNTLRYRLRTFAEATGLQLDRPQDAFTVWWALRRLDALQAASGTTTG